MCGGEESVCGSMSVVRPHESLCGLYALPDFRFA